MLIITRGTKFRRRVGPGGLVVSLWILRAGIGSLAASSWQKSQALWFSTSCNLRNKTTTRFSHVGKGWVIGRIKSNHLLNATSSSGLPSIYSSPPSGAGKARHLNLALDSCRLRLPTFYCICRCCCSNTNTIHVDRRNVYRYFVGGNLGITRDCWSEHAALA